MPKFMVRVVLRERDGEDSIPAGDYTALHDELEDSGFLRTIRGDSGTNYHLPPAEYRLDTAEKVGVKEVREAVDSAILRANLRRRYAILVVRYTTAAWLGLEEAE